MTAIRLLGASFLSLPLLLFPTSLLGLEPGSDKQANLLLQQGRVEEASEVLHKILSAQPGDALAHQLLCRVSYAQDIAEDAARECELAALNDPHDSTNQLWLGRAEGLKASRASPFAAIGLAKKVHLAFERAIQLDPSNVAAMSDLGEYYIAAPSLLSGGIEKAEALAATMRERYPAKAHRLLALVAEKRKDPDAAEVEFKEAVAAGRSPEAYIDLAFFYQRHKQMNKVLPVIQEGIKADLRKDNVLVDAASILTSAHLSPELAEELLRDYLDSPAKSDGAPAFKVHLQLGKLLADRGDIPGARREYAAALALAPNYAPARKAMQGS